MNFDIKKYIEQRKEEVKNENLFWYCKNLKIQELQELENHINGKPERFKTEPLPILLNHKPKSKELLELEEWEKERISEFIFKEIQIKSIEKARLFASLLDTMEIEFWIKVCKLQLENCFICPDITRKEIDTLNKTAMEKSVKWILEQLQNF